MAIRKIKLPNEQEPREIGALSSNVIYDAVTPTVSLNQKISSMEQIIEGLNSFEIAVVNSLPTQDIDDHTIYFVPQSQGSTTHDEYMYINNTWELIGTTTIDLSDYVTETELTTALTPYLQTSEITVTQGITTGIEIGSIDVNGTTTSLYAPEVPENQSDLNYDYYYTIIAGVNNENRVIIDSNSNEISWDDLDPYCYYIEELSVDSYKVYRLIWNESEQEYELLSLGGEGYYVPEDGGIGPFGKLSTITNNVDTITLYHKAQGTFGNTSAGAVSSLSLYDNNAEIYSKNITIAGSEAVSISGTTVTIIGLEDLTQDSDGTSAANKNYVDSQISAVTSSIPSITATAGLTTGVAIGNIDINGTTTTLYAPAAVTPPAYSLSMSGATITLLADNVAASTITLPIYDGTIQ